jgi:hypothetical protein
VEMTPPGAVDTLRSGLTRAAITQPLEQSVIDEALQGYPPKNREMYARAMAQAIDAQKKSPSWVKLLIDDRDNLWAERGPGPWGTSTWDVFDPAGRPRAIATLPKGLAITSVSTHMVIGTRATDALHTRVEAYRIH